MERKSRYADAMERALYNGVMSGMAMDGKAYFYVNPLEVNPRACEERDDLNHVKYRRQPWYQCACCPPNLARLIASFGEYLYTARDDEIAVHLYAQSQTVITMDGGDVRITQTTNYPWDGSVKITVNTATPRNFTVSLRIPSWCDTWSVAVGGLQLNEIPVENGYALIERQWGGEDIVELELEMPVIRVKGTSANPYTLGRCALQRGPLVYCLEEIDNGDRLGEIVLPQDAALVAVPWREIRPEYMVLHGTGIRQRISPPDGFPYAVAERNTTEQRVTAIPYFAWANRTAGEMKVWIREG